MNTLRPDVDGYCPMGCGRTLFLGDGGWVTCSWAHCPNPSAVADILAERETDHVVQIDPGTFTVKHPLRERLNDELLTCRVHNVIAAFSGPPRAVGVYRVQLAPEWFDFDNDHAWAWNPITEETRS